MIIINSDNIYEIRKMRLAFALVLRPIRDPNHIRLNQHIDIVGLFIVDSLHHTIISVVISW